MKYGVVVIEKWEAWMDQFDTLKAAFEAVPKTINSDQEVYVVEIIAKHTVEKKVVAP